MNRYLLFLYGVVCYTIGMGGLAAFVLFIGPWELLPFHIDDGVAGDPVAALASNLLLILAFGLQHSVMARRGFKKLLSRFIPVAAERSTYVLFSGLMMLLICAFWLPLPGIIWETNNAVLEFFLQGGYLAGWTLAVVATFVINHFELFGLQQVYLHFRSRHAQVRPLVTEGLYALVRHPLQLGVFVGIWSTPVMTTTHFVLAVTMTLYIFIGLYFEEKDLVRAIGADYVEYQKQVPKLFPRPAKNRLVLRAGAPRS